MTNKATKSIKHFLLNVFYLFLTGVYRFILHKTYTEYIG